MKISLCVICGNEAAQIGAMLKSFERVVDEVSLVRAIGSQEPDGTEQIVRDWCERNEIGFVFSEYKNGVTAQAWKHVDSFAKARNQSFAQATGDWLLWADCDDVISCAERIRQRLSELSDDVLMLRCPYDVRGTGKKLQRERIIRRSAFASGRVWHHDVHENLLLLPNDRHFDWTTPVWHHEPIAIKQDNRKRNLAILGRSVSDSATQYFYIHQEHYCAGNKAAAEQFGRIAISFPNLDDSFRYEVQLNLARLVSSRRDAMQFAMSAHGVFPWCREAIASIILLAFERNDGKRASFWASRMLALPEPAGKDRPWTHEVKWYGWAGHDLAARAFRLAGQHDDAAAMQLVFHKHKHPKIRLVQKTLGNSTRSVSFRDAWLSTAAKPETIEHRFLVRSDDAETMAMAKQFLHDVDKPSAESGAIEILAEDGMIPPHNWDDRILASGCKLIDAENIEQILGVKKA
jgi:regulator of extracellular matrix RemA (YlzA/DUF370 family)